MAKSTKETTAPDAETTMAPKAAAAKADKGPTVKVPLAKARLYREMGKTEADTYGPGEVEVPLDMARGLVQAGELEPDVLPEAEAAAIKGARQLAAANALRTG